MGRRPTLEDLQRIAPGRVSIPVLRNQVHKLNKNHDTGPKKELGLILFAFCQQQGYELKTELQAIPGRKFRFDWAIMDLKIAVEYEGLIADKSGHLTIVGYTQNCTKYNLAQVEGWKVLRYTVKNYMEVGSDLMKLINKYDNTAPTPYS